MPGGKRKLKQLFVGQIQSGASGTAITQILAGSVSFTGPVFAGGASSVSGSKETAELTITSLDACSVMLYSVSGLSACVSTGEILAGAGTASLIFEYSGSGASTDPYSGVVRYISISVA